MSVEAVIVAVWIAVLLLVASTPVLVCWEWARANDRPARRPAYRGGHRAARPRRLAHAINAFAAGWREMAHASALLRGDLDAA